jgi:hypothetical protein
MAAGKAYYQATLYVVNALSKHPKEPNVTKKPDLHLIEQQLAEAQPAQTQQDPAREAVLRGLGAYDELNERCITAENRADSYDRANVILTAENERLGRELHKVKMQRDHFFKAFTALRSKLQAFTHFQKSGAAMLDESIRLAEVQGYGDQAPPVGRPVRPASLMDDGAPVPAFLAKP